MSVKNIFVLVALVALLSACAPTKPVVQYASENAITLKYSAYDIVPTVTPEAIEMAIEHCAKYGKSIKLMSSNAAHELSTQEIHTFMCTD